MSDALERLQRSARVAPPPVLDDYVRNAMHSALREQLLRTEGDAPAPQTPPVPVPLAERCVYALGLIAYGAQAVAMAFRLVWRVVSG